MPEEYAGDDVLGNDQGFVKLLVGASEHNLDDRSGLRDRLSDYIRMEEPRNMTTDGNHKLKWIAAGIFNGGYTIDRMGVRQQLRLPGVMTWGARHWVQFIFGSERNGAGSYNHLPPGGIADRDQRFYHLATASRGRQQLLHAQH